MTDLSDPATGGRLRWLPTLQNRFWRYATFFSSYFYQGIVAGFSLTALANYYAGRGVSAGEVGLHFAIAGLPWTIQPILWGPFVDRAGSARMGRRRVWGVAAILGSHVALCGLLAVPGAENLGLVGAVFLLHSTFASLLDTACDRMIMDHVPAAELGRMSACTRSGFVAGTSLSAALFATTLPDWGFAPSVRLLIVLGLAATILPLLVRERPCDALVSLAADETPGPARPPVPFRRFLRKLILGLRRPTALRMLAVCFCIDCVLSLFEVRYGVDLVQTGGWDASSLSRIQAALALVGGTLGAIAIGTWSDRAGPWTALTVLFLASAAAYLGASGLLAAGLSAAAGPLILGLTTVLPNLLIVALVPALMTTSRRGAGAATQFEVFMATMNLGSVTGASLSGPAAEIAPLWLVGAGVAVVLLASGAICRGRSWKPERSDRQAAPA